MLPTAETEITHRAPRNRKPQMLARKEDDPAAGETAHAVRVGRHAERRGDLPPRDVGQALELVEPTAANDADRGLALRGLHRSLASALSSSPNVRSPSTDVTFTVVSVRT